MLQTFIGSAQYISYLLPVYVQTVGQSLDWGFIFGQGLLLSNSNGFSFAIADIMWLATSWFKGNIANVVGEFKSKAGLPMYLCRRTKGANNIHRE